MQSNYQKGELILQAQPYAHVLSQKERAKRCDFCFARGGTLKRCSRCNLLWYCNATCQRQDWQLHKVECRCLCQSCPQIPSESVRLMLRLLIREQRGDDDKVLPYDPGWRTFSSLQSHASEIAEDHQRFDIFTQLVATLTVAVGDILPLPAADDLLELFGKMVINTFNICDEDLQSIGSGLYVSASLLDHSCQPNAAIVFQGSTLLIHALMEIRNCSPAKVFISYVEPLSLPGERHPKLQKQYYFTCQCPRCQHPAQDALLLSWQCPVSGCRGQVPMDCNERLLACSICLTSQFSANSISKIYQVLTDSKRVNQEIEERKKTEEWRAILQLSETCLADQFEVCDPHNIYHLRTLEHAFDALINLQDWEKAACYGEKISAASRALLLFPSASVGLQLLRLGKLQLYLQRLSSSLQALEQAKDILLVTHGTRHPVVTTLMYLLNQCHEELQHQAVVQ